MRVSAESGCSLTVCCSISVATTAVSETGATAAEASGCSGINGACCCSGRDPTHRRVPRVAILSGSNAFCRFGVR